MSGLKDDCKFPDVERDDAMQSCEPENDQIPQMTGEEKNDYILTVVVQIVR